MLFSFLLASSLPAADFHAQWPPGADRPWPGPEFWSNPLQDWRVRAGRLECFVPGGDRNVYLLTRDIEERGGTLDMSVRLGRLEGDSGPLDEGFVGFRIGIRGAFDDYRDSAVRGVGLNAGIASDGRLFVGRLGADAPRIEGSLKDVALRLRAQAAAGAYRILLEAIGPDEAKLAEMTRSDVPARWIVGGVALVCSSGKVEETPGDEARVRDTGFTGKPGTARGGTLRFWFRDWKVSGSNVVAHQDCTFGPILFTMHTLNRGLLKMTAQMAPVGNAPQDLVLQFRGGAELPWRAIASTRIDPLARTATFRVPGWDDSRDIAYRVVYNMPDGNGNPREYFFEGTIRRDPIEKQNIVVAAFTGNNDLGFPHADVVQHVSYFRPDLLVYTGDQIYERVGEYGIQRAPLETAALDYLRKWFIFGWEYRDLLRDTPAVCLPDDHDVYHGNLWGAGGRHSEGEGYEGQDRGGYVMPAEWVNMVQRTQTSHMADPYDPTRVEQGIGVYYGSMLYGGVSIAVVEDRKWKSAPKEFLQSAQIVNGWAQNPDYNAARDGDAPGAQLLGPRQIDFLNSWAQDWSGGAWMKVVVSQTLFSNVATLPAGAKGDQSTPTLRVARPGEYPAGEMLVADHDSNGWPQSARNEALRAMRRGFAFHISGDQHLGSTVQYGIDNWNDAAYAICVPSVANVWPRRWYPPMAGRNRKPGSPKYTGEFLDGFGNKVTVHAVSNPTEVGIEPAAINRRAPGYGIVVFDRATRKITIANWPRWVDPSRPGAKPYAGWPITTNQLDNGMPKPGLSLGPIRMSDMVDPVVQVIDQGSGEVIYTVRIKGTSFTPRVFKAGTYTVKVTDPDRRYEMIHRDLEAK